MTLYVTKQHPVLIVAIALSVLIVGFGAANLVGHAGTHLLGSTFRCMCASCGWRVPAARFVEYVATVSAARFVGYMATASAARFVAYMATASAAPFVAYMATASAARFVGCVPVACVVQLIVVLSDSREFLAGVAGFVLECLSGCLQQRDSCLCQ